jgi:hypothetical protein
VADGKPVDADVNVDVDVMLGDVKMSFLVGIRVVKKVDRVVAGVDELVDANVEVDVLPAVVEVLNDGQDVDDVGHSVLVDVLVEVVVVPGVTARATGRTVDRAIRLKVAAVVVTMRANLLE